MLEKILETLIEHRHEELHEFPNKVPNKVPNKLKAKHPEISDATWKMCLEIMKRPSATASIIANILGITDRTARKHIAQLKAANIIERKGSNKAGYWKVNLQ